MSLENNGRNGQRAASGRTHEASADPPLAAGLYIVATPIGNLEDITLRALRVLGSVDRIACEDTRQTKKLLTHFGIAVPTISCHAHNERERTEELLAAMQTGARIALVSDAGMPGISDPGAYLVAEAVAAGIPVIPIPGACAAIAAVAASGLDTRSFRFVGFPPSQAGARRRFLEELQTDRATLILYEAPHRIVATLRDAKEIFGADRRGVLAREITKLHEEILRGTLFELENALTDREILRGEMTLLIASADPAETASVKSPTSLRDRMNFYRSQGLDEQAALKRIAKERGVGKSEVYREWQQERPRGR